MGRCVRLSWEHAVEAWRTAPVRRPGVTTGHLLLGVLKEDACAGGLILRMLDFDLERATAITDFILLHSRPKDPKPADVVEWEGVPHSLQAYEALELSWQEADLFSATYPIGTEHLLLALLRVPESIGYRTMHFLGTHVDVVRAKRDSFWELLKSPE